MSRRIVIHKQVRAAAITEAPSRTIAVAAPTGSSGPSGIGTIVGGWVVLLVGSIVGMFPPLWLPGFALLLAAGILSITGMIRGSIGGGILLLLGCFIMPYLLWFVLGAAIGIAFL